MTSRQGASQRWSCWANAGGLWTRVVHFHCGCAHRTFEVACAARSVIHRRFSCQNVMLTKSVAAHPDQGAGRRDHQPWLLRCHTRHARRRRSSTATWRPESAEWYKPTANDVFPGALFVMRWPPERARRKISDHHRAIVVDTRPGVQSTVTTDAGGADHCHPFFCLAGQDP